MTDIARKAYKTMRSYLRYQKGDYRKFAFWYGNNRTSPISEPAQAALRTLDGSLFSDALRAKAESQLNMRSMNDRKAASEWCRFSISRYRTRLP